MKIYLLIMDRKKPAYYNFAEFGHSGTWTKEHEKCDVCGFHDQHLTEPLLAEWRPGSDVIGDFSWCSYCIIVKDRVRRFMVNQQFEAEFGRVEIVKPFNICRRKKRVAWPYVGPQLHWLRPTERIHLDIARSDVEVSSDCAICGRLDYSFKMDGLVIAESEVKCRKMFRIEEFGNSSATFISQEALDSLIGQEFTNFWYREAGVTA